jgi:LPS-assembly lipoprotein
MRLAALLLAVGLGLAACGYKPIYRALDGQGLADVSIRQVAMTTGQRAAGERRVAQLVNQRLMRRFSGGENARYKMDVSIEEVLSTIAVRRDATDQRYALLLNGRVFLYRGDELVMDVILTTNAPYNVEDSPYGTESGRDRARQSAANTLADEILLRVTRYLADPE